MKQKLILGCMSCCLAIYLSSCCNPEIIGNVPNTLQAQQTANWCWAATTQMLAQHFGISVTQCDLANHRFGRSDCCTGDCPKTDSCNKPGWPELDYVGLKFSDSQTPLSWASLKSQIFCNKTPMGYAYGTTGVVGHVLVIKGYVSVGSTNYLVLNDPWSPCNGSERLITYEEYSDPAGTATHWDTFYNLAKK